MSLEQYLLEHYSPASLRRYVRLIEQYRQVVRDPLTAGYQEVLDYLGALRKRGLHPKSIRNHLAAIKIYYRYLEVTNQRAEHPCQHLYLRDQINRAVKLEVLYSAEQLEELEQAFAEAPKVDRIIINLLIHQALSSGEIKRLSVDDIDLENQQITIRESEYPGRRTNLGRTLAMTKEQTELIRNYLENERGPSEQKHLLLTVKELPLWSGYINRMLKRNSMGRHFKPQQIRQSVIANLLKAGHDLRVVQAFAGHRKAGSTEQYQSNKLEELRSAVQKYHPLQ